MKKPWRLSLTHRIDVLSSKMTNADDETKRNKQDDPVPNGSGTDKNI